MADEQIALRVSQLDASELDSELFDLLRNQFTGIFKYFKPKFLSRYGPEINASLRFLLWKYTIYSESATVGQQLLDLKYKNDRDVGKWMSTNQKVLFALTTVLGPWFSERSYIITNHTKNTGYDQQIEKALRWIDKGWKIATLLNFLIFLQQGRYRSLVERILGIRAVFPHPQGIRQVGFEYMDRELLWHGFAEFLLFVIPFINFRRIKNFLWLYLMPKSEESERPDRELKECGICEQWPFNPHQIGCRHVYCYYCIKSNFMADPGYCCPQCGYKVEIAENIEPVRLKPIKQTSAAVNR